jgi:hypothetical protein
MKQHVVIAEILLALTPSSNHGDEICILREEFGQCRDVVPIPVILPAGLDIPNSPCIG